MWVNKVKEKWKMRRHTPVIQEESERNVCRFGNKDAGDQKAQEKTDAVVCKKCGATLLKPEAVANKYVCMKCGYHFRVRTKNRIKMTADAGTFEPWFEDIGQTDPLNFPGYADKLAQVQEKTKLKDSVTVGYARIGGEPAVIGICDARFLMGSMGHATGEKITLAVEKATKLRLPVILFCCSGGARMQEGIISLMQMSKTAAALKKHSDAGLLYISVLTDPTTGRNSQLCNAGGHYFGGTWCTDWICRAKGH